MLTDAHKHVFLSMHIAYKLGAIDMCAEIVDMLKHLGDQHPTVVSFGTTKSMKFKHVRPVTNAFVEHGFMSCRVMLEFLGVGLDKTQTALAEYHNHRSDTVTLRDFGRPLLSVAE